MVWASKLYADTIADLTGLGFTLNRHTPPHQSHLYKVVRGKFTRLDGVSVGISQRWGKGRYRWDETPKVKAKPTKPKVKAEECDSWLDYLRINGYREVFDPRHGYCYVHDTSGTVFTELGEVVTLDDET